MNRRSNHTWIAGGLLAILVLLAITQSALAQLPGVGGVPVYAPPFDMIGFMQDAGLGAAGTRGVYNSGNRTQEGWMVVNNVTIVVPKNTVLQMPATSLTWADLFDPNGPSAVVPGTGTCTTDPGCSPSVPAASPYGGDVTSGGTRTGMSMSDPLRMPGTYEVHVQGNIVSGKYIAGLIFIAPQSLNATNGYVTRIDYNAGDLYVSGGPGSTEIRVQINDPIGRFGKAHSPDQRFTMDEENPTVHAETGYPMCVARVAPPAVDPLCPEYNRPLSPLGGYVMNYTMGDPSLLGPNVQGPDARIMAPIEVGDYLTIAGMLVPDPTQVTGYYISAYNIDNNVGIYTAPVTDPVYVVLGEMEQGTGGVANIAFPQETTSRVKVEGMSTDSDPRRTIQIGARDTDCNGVVTDRAPWMAALPIDPGPPTGAKRGRIRWRPNGGPFLPPAKEIHLIASGANTVTPTANGLFPGQYYAPQFAFIFPENLGVGDPPVTLNFSDFVWLNNGIGPFGPGATIGQLAPYPDLNAPPTTCTAATAPGTVTANAGGPYSITPSALAGAGSASGTVTMAASFSVPAGVTPVFSWQVATAPAGAPVPTFSSTSTLNPTVSVTVPSTSGPLSYGLSLTVQNSANPAQTATAFATLTVNASAVPPATPTITLSSGSVASGATFTASSTAVAGQTYTFSAPANCATLASQTGASATFTAATIAAGGSAISCSVTVTTTNGAGLSASNSAPLTVNAPTAAQNTPSITAGSFRITPNPALAGQSVTITATVTQPAAVSNQAMSYTWTITNISVVPNTSFTITGTINSGTSGTATATFTAPTVGAGLSNTLSIKLVASNAQGPSAAATTSMLLNGPQPDVLSNNATLYRTSKSRLTVNVISSVVSPAIVLTATLDLINPATGLHYSGTMNNLGGGSYTLDFIGVGLPNSIQVTSTGGGILTITQAQISVRQ